MPTATMILSILAQLLPIIQQLLASLHGGNVPPHVTGAVDMLSQHVMSVNEENQTPAS